jgi:hypothetical protein
MLYFYLKNFLKILLPKVYPDPGVYPETSGDPSLGTPLIKTTFFRFS